MIRGVADVDMGCMVLWHVPHGEAELEKRTHTHVASQYAYACIK